MLSNFFCLHLPRYEKVVSGFVKLVVDKSWVGYDFADDDDDDDGNDVDDVEGKCRKIAASKTASKNHTSDGNGFESRYSFIIRI